MTLSLNEVETIAKRATRGAGQPWGLADEAAKACRWLCVQGLDGVGSLTTDLETGAQTLIKGVSLSDRASILSTEAVTLPGVSTPLMILPFAANAARLIKACVTVKCGGVVAVTDGRSLELAQGFPDRSETVTIASGGVLTTARTHATRAAPLPRDWQALNALAHRTYAPATEESRARGAGAGTTDND